MAGAEVIQLCLENRSDDPIALFERLVALEDCPMHGPIHHQIVGSALLSAYQNAGGRIDLPAALDELQKRSSQVPGGACGMWGACGAAISAGMFLSIVTDSGPLNENVWGLPNRMTAAALSRMGEIGGPRCCKRNSYTAILAAVAFVRENLGIEMHARHPLCSRSHLNAQCIAGRCPYFGGSIA